MIPGVAKRRGLLGICIFGTLLFGSLGAWQVQRLAWKRDLIARVEARLDAAPVAVPARDDWATLDLHEAEYRRVRVSGSFLHEHETLVDALTVRGPGAWVMTPLLTRDGVVLVNRGFVPTALQDADVRAAGQVAGEVTLTGLLRAPEPGGRVLRANDPAAGRWYSRDVAAMGAARGLEGMAPFFIDVDAESAVAGGPVGGLTVLHFRNAHLVYAATWFALALLCVAGLVLLRKPPGAGAQEP